MFFLHEPYSEVVIPFFLCILRTTFGLSYGFLAWLSFLQFWSVIFWFSRWHSCRFVKGSHHCQSLDVDISLATGKLISPHFSLSEKTFDEVNSLDYQFRCCQPVCILGVWFFSTSGKIDISRWTRNRNLCANKEGSQ